MQLLDDLRSFLGYERKIRKPKQSKYLPPWVYAGGPGLGPIVSAWTDSRIEQVRHFKHWTYVAITRIAEKIAQQIPIISVVRKPGEGDAGQYLPELEKRKALTPIQAHENLTPTAHDHPLNALFRKPNDWDSPFDLWHETLIYLKLTGSAYWWIAPNNAGYPAEIWVLPSHWVWPVPDKQGQIRQYQLRPVEGAYSGAKIPADHVIHFRHKSPISKLDGYSPQTAGSQWIDGVESIDKSRWHAFRNGIFPGVAVEFDKDSITPTPEQLDRIEARMVGRYGGEHRAGRPLFVPGGAKVKPLTIVPREMDWGSSFEQLRDSTLALFGVPAVVAGITKDMTYGSVQAALAAFCSFTINPLMAYLGQAITQNLAARYDPKLRVWWPDCTPEDPAVRENEIRTDVDAGTITYNEQRALRGRKPWKDGDRPIEKKARSERQQGGSGDPDRKKPGKAEKPEATDKVDGGQKKPAKSIAGVLSVLRYAAGLIEKPVAEPVKPESEDKASE